ncbi:MAG: hypothetical protein R3F14_17865 [Polyangiaceae bacterium]
MASEGRVERVLPGRAPRPSGEERELAAETGYLVVRLSEGYLYTNRQAAYLGAILASSRLAEQGHDPATLARSHVVVGVALAGMRLPRAALRFIESSRRSAVLSGELDTELYQAQVEAYYWHLQLDTERSTGILDAALAKARAAGATFRTEQLLTVSCIARHHRDHERAIHDARLLRASGRARAHKLSEAFGEMLLGLVLGSTGAHEASLSSLRAASGLLDTPNLIVQRANCHAGMADCHLARGDLASAQAEAAIARRLVPKLSPANTIAPPMHAYLPWVDLATWADRRARGLSAAEEERRARESIAGSARFARVVRWHEPDALRQKGELARLCGWVEEAVKSLHRSVAVARELKLRGQEARARADLARVDRARRGLHLAEARRLYTEMGLSRLAAGVGPSRVNAPAE